MPGPDRTGGLDRRRFLGLAGAGAAAGLLPRRAFAAGPALNAWVDGAPSAFTLSNATIVTHTGERLPGAGIRVESGRIVEVGTSVKGGTDLGGAWIVPGFTDAGCTVGLYEIGLEKGSRDDNESSDAVTPDARAMDAYNPLSEVVPVTRAAGFTHVLVHPSGGLVSGQAALMRTAGVTVEDTVIARDDIAFPLCINLGHGALGGGSGAPASRMGVAMKLRALLDAVDLPEDAPEDDKGKKRRKKGDAGGGKEIEPDEDLDPIPLLWRRVRRGDVPVLFRAERADDILQVVQLKHHYGLHAAILGGAEAWLVADRLAESDIGVLLGPPTVQPNSFEHPHAVYENPKLLDDAGVKLAFRSGSNHFSRVLKTEVGVACAHGLRWETAIRGLTCGLEDVLGYTGHGRLEAGASASFFVVGGDPLQPRFPVQRVWIDGREATLDTRQSRLAERYRELW